jgi:hypothetical protein
MGRSPRSCAARGCITAISGSGRRPGTRGHCPGSQMRARQRDARTSDPLGRPGASSGRPRGKPCSAISSPRTGAPTHGVPGSTTPKNPPTVSVPRPARLSARTQTRPRCTQVTAHTLRSSAILRDGDVRRLPQPPHLGLDRPSRAYPNAILSARVRGNPGSALRGADLHRRTRAGSQRTCFRSLTRKRSLVSTPRRQGVSVHSASTTGSIPVSPTSISAGQRPFRRDPERFLCIGVPLRVPQRGGARTSADARQRTVPPALELLARFVLAGQRRAYRIAREAMTRSVFRTTEGVMGCEVATGQHPPRQRVSTRHPSALAGIRPQSADNPCVHSAYINARGPPSPKGESASDLLSY